MKIHYYLLFVGSVLITGSCAPTTTTWNANTSRTRAFSAHVHAYNNPGSITPPSTYIPSTDWSDSSYTTDYSYISTSNESDSSSDSSAEKCTRCRGTGKTRTFMANEWYKENCATCGGDGRVDYKPTFPTYFLFRR